MSRPVDSDRVGNCGRRRGPRSAVYQALRELWCQQCGSPIAVGDGFTGSVLHGRRLVPGAWFLAGISTKRLAVSHPVERGARHQAPGAGAPAIMSKEASDGD